LSYDNALSVVAIEGATMLSSAYRRVFAAVTFS